MNSFSINREVSHWGYNKVTPQKFFLVKSTRYGMQI
jgi:hypothetical protein